MFGKRLRAARMYRKFTQQHMADIIGSSLNSYQKYEQSDRYPSFEMLVRLADTLDVPTDWLLGRDEYLASLGVSVDVPR
jgi:transcriptional regulator with XRE-family HTH domain